MNLNEWPARANTGRPSCIDMLPDDVREQLIAARTSGSHSVSAMVAWLKHLGHETVTANALYNWFTTRGITRAEP
jgi:hypothetical protein